MKNWDLQEKNLAQMVDIPQEITNMPQENLLSNSSSVSLQKTINNTLEHPSPSVSHQTSDVVTPMPSKRMKLN